MAAVFDFSKSKLFHPHFISGEDIFLPWLIRYPHQESNFQPFPRRYSFLIVLHTIFPPIASRSRQFFYEFSTPSPTHGPGWFSAFFSPAKKSPVQNFTLTPPHGFPHKCVFVFRYLHAISHPYLECTSLFRPPKSLLFKTTHFDTTP